jgi:hypothetical protein
MFLSSAHVGKIDDSYPFSAAVNMEEERGLSTEAFRAVFEIDSEGVECQTAFGFFLNARYFKRELGPYDAFLEC